MTQKIYKDIVDFLHNNNFLKGIMFYQEEIIHLVAVLTDITDEFVKQNHNMREK